MAGRARRGMGPMARRPRPTYKHAGPWAGHEETEMDERNGSWRPGAIVWREAASTDLDRTTAFYETLFGWTHHDSEMGHGGVYRHFRAGGADIAGGYQIGGPMAGTPPHWMQYLSVVDVDAAAEQARALGGTIVMGPFEIPDVGRVAYVRDPQGAHIALFRDGKGDAPASTERPAVGTFCWESLMATDKQAAAHFYTTVTALRAKELMGMATLALGDSPADGVADIGDAPPGGHAAWLSHVVVADLDQSRAQAESLGASVLMREVPIPGVGRICVIQDPIGAVISMFEAETPS